MARVESNLIPQLPVDIPPSKIPVEITKVSQRKEHQVIVVNNLLGRPAIVTVIEPRGSRKKPANLDPFPPAA